MYRPEHKAFTACFRGLGGGRGLTHLGRSASAPPADIAVNLHSRFVRKFAYRFVDASYTETRSQSVIRGPWSLVLNRVGMVKGTLLSMVVLNVTLTPHPRLECDNHVLCCPSGGHGRGHRPA